MTKIIDKMNIQISVRQRQLPYEPREQLMNNILGRVPDQEFQMGNEIGGDNLLNLV